MNYTGLNQEKRSAKSASRSRIQVAADQYRIECDRAKVHELKAANKSCANCSSLTQIRFTHWCACKNKPMHSYNICPMHTALLDSTGRG